jgi:hypothetical protein
MLVHTYLKMTQQNFNLWPHEFLLKELLYVYNKYVWNQLTFLKIVHQFTFIKVKFL